MAITQLHLEFGWLAPSASVDEELAHLRPRASREYELPDDEVLAVVPLGFIARRQAVRVKQPKIPAEKTQAAHSFARVKAIAEGRTRGKMPPDFYGAGLEIATPTDATPGSPEKIAVLETRAARRQKLFHPRDATADVQ